jgi:hypothetical protein
MGKQKRVTVKDQIQVTHQNIVARQNIDYNAVVSLSAEEFKALASCAELDLVNPKKFTKSDQEDIAKMERLLDVTEGTLSGQDYYLGRSQCECGRLLTMYDFVFTGLIDAGHSKSLILHTFVGTKYILNPPRKVRCSQCGRLSTKADIY